MLGPMPRPRTAADNFYFGTGRRAVVNASNKIEHVGCLCLCCRESASAIPNMKSMHNSLNASECCVCTYLYYVLLDQPRRVAC